MTAPSAANSRANGASPSDHAPAKPSAGRARQLLRNLRPSVITGGASATPLLVLFALNSADELDQAAAAVLLPEIRDWFGVSITVVLSASAFAAFIGLLLAIPIGYLADRVNRVRLSALGATAWGVATLLTGLAPTFGVLILARVTSGIGKTLEPAHSSLLADWYPPRVRAGVFALHRSGNNIGRLVAPLAAGGLATAFFWQLPFLLFAVPSLALAVCVILRLREPVRGEQERRAMGADEATATTAEVPPNWTESWRIARNVSSLRRIWWSLPFLVGSGVVIGNLMSLYYEEEFHLNAAERGVLFSIDEVFALLGLLFGAALGNRLLRFRPGRVFTYIALLAAARALTVAVIALFPALPLVVLFSVIGAFVGSLFAPAAVAMMTMVIPPRARGYALSLGVLFILPGQAIAPVAGRVADSYGLQAALLLMVPVVLIGAAIFGSTAAGVDADIRRAQAASMALARTTSAAQEGVAKAVVCRDLDVHYGAVQVLFNVDFEVDEGEVVALLGTNGAGKSTLLRAISGLTPPSGGAILVDNQDISYLPPADHARRGIIGVPGGRGVFPTLTVRENLRMAAWLYRRDKAYLRDGIERVLGYFPALRPRLAEAAGNLSGGEQQMVALGQGLLARPRLLMIDELSLGLGPAVVADLLGIVRTINAQGTTIILVEQSVNVALTLADRAVFMEKGAIRFSGPAAELLNRPDVLRSAFLAGAGGGSLGSRRAVGAPAPGPGAAVPALEVTDLTRRFGGVTAVDHVSFAVAPGTILGIIGANGSGKTTLFDLVCGYLDADGGQVLLDGEQISGLSPDNRAKRGLHRSFQNARLFPSLCVRENVQVCLERFAQSRDPFSASLRLRRSRRSETRLAKRADRLAELLSLGDYLDIPLGELSTGTRRVVDIACVLATDPKVVLLDEPSAGIAQRETEELGPLLRRIRHETKATILVIEHDIPLISSVSDELIAMQLGGVITRGAPADVLRDPQVVESYLGTTPAAIARSGVS